MTSIRFSVETCLLVASLLAAGCGKTTRLGHERPDAYGGATTGGEGGTSASGGAAGTAGDSGAAGESGASGDAGSSGEAGSSGGSATGGAAGSGAAGSRSDSGLACHLPKPTPVPNPSAEELERRRLIHEYCATLARDNCWNIGGGSQIDEQTMGCSTEERITACELDRLYEYVKDILPACDDEWQTAIKCRAAATYVPCEPSRLCTTEQEALNQCIASNFTGNSVTGSRTTCQYGVGRQAPCQVFCTVGTNAFSMACGGPAGLPLECNCIANWHDPSLSFYASDCREAAQLAADGVFCTNHLDCCVEWPEGPGAACSCGPSNLGGYPSCEAYAESEGGRRVELCPPYKYMQ